MDESVGRKAKSVQLSACRMIFAPWCLRIERQAQQAFTLLELLVVLAIVALLAAVVAPRMVNSDTLLFKAQLKEAVSALNYARRRAIIDGEPVDASFIKQGKEIRKPLQGQWISRGATIRVADDSALQRTAHSENGEFDKLTVITFFPGGGSNGGELYLEYAENTAIIKVDPLTGSISSEIFKNRY